MVDEARLQASVEWCLASIRGSSDPQAAMLACYGQLAAEGWDGAALAIIQLRVSRELRRAGDHPHQAGQPGGCATS